MILVRPVIAALAWTALVWSLTGCGGQNSSAIGRSAVSVAQESRAESGRQYTLGPQFEDQLEQMISREAVALGVKENVPMELNRQVLLNIDYFLNNSRGFMLNGLSRGSKYIPMMKAIFRQKGLPEDLVYLALIESGFRTEAVSHAQAVGPWQFIAATGRRYGLTINEWVDERMDPVKSTFAAADYLTMLHDMFGSWPLAIAAYNSGEGKIVKGIQNYGVNNFWDMSDVGGHLAAETKLYVPSFLAATFIAKDPAAYGLKIDLQQPDQWDEVVVPAPIDLKDAADFSGATVDRLKELNPHLKKSATPPNEADFVLRIPAGSMDRFAEAYARSGKGGQPLVPAVADSAPSPRPAAASVFPVQTAGATSSGPNPRLSNITHKVQPGDTLGSIARLYGASVEALKRRNGLKSSLVKAGQILKIQSDLPLTAQAPAAAGPVMVVETAAAPRATTTHTVTAGENLGVIAQRYNMSVRELADINNIQGVTIRVGQVLTVKAPAGQTRSAAGPSSSPSTAAAAGRVHTVASGETLGGIALKYGLKTKDLMALNGLSGPNIRVGQKLKISAPAPAARAAAAKPAPREPSPASGPETTASQTGRVSLPQPAARTRAATPPEGVHVVSAGENLGGIALKYGLKTKDLMALNGLSGPNIRVGQKLRISGPAPAARAAASGGGKGAAHKVAEGDTLYNIAKRYQMSVDDLRKLNNLSGNTIRLGQSLKVK